MDINETLNPRPQCLTDYQPRVARGLGEYIYGPYSTWTKNLAFFDKPAVEKSEKLGR